MDSKIPVLTRQTTKSTLPRIDETPRNTPDKDPVKMSIVELRRYAKDKGIKTGQSPTKIQILQALGIDTEGLEISKKQQPKNNNLLNLSKLRAAIRNKLPECEDAVKLLNIHKLLSN